MFASINAVDPSAMFLAVFLTHAVQKEIMLPVNSRMLKNGAPNSNSRHAKSELRNFSRLNFPASSCQSISEIRYC